MQDWTKILRSNWWLILAIAGFLGYLPWVPMAVVLLNFLFLWPLMRPLIRRVSGVGRAGTDEQKPPEMPTAPVAGGNLMVMVRFIGFIIVANLWPPGLVSQFRQIVGNARAASRAIDDPAGYRQRARYRLPFDEPPYGEWYIFNGGPNEATSHSWTMVAQSYAYDFVVVRDGRQRWRDGSDGGRSSDYLCYDLPILAPADGVVVEVVDGIRDAPRPGTGWLDPFARDIRGNCVTIQHAEGEYSVLAHLVPGSIVVREGHQVTQGEVIGRCGNSGNSSEPHLHFHLQDRADFLSAAGRPIAFDDVAVDGREPQDDQYLVRGSRIRPVRNTTRAGARVVSSQENR